MIKYRYKKVRVKIKGKKPSIPAYKSYAGHDKTFLFDSGEQTYSPTPMSRPQYVRLPKKKTPLISQVRGLGSHLKTEAKKSQSIFSNTKKRRSPLGLTFR